MAKYLGPKSDPANVATQADLASAGGGVEVSATAPEDPSAGDAWFDSTTGEIYIYYDGFWVSPAVIASVPTAAALTITGTNAEGSSTSFARADHDHAYGTGSIPQSALALGPTYETSLPGSPVDGQEIYYQDTGQMATDGIVWHLRYRSGGGTYKWEFVGGGSLRAEDNDFRSLTNQTTFADVPTDTIVVTIPLAGEYEVEHSAAVFVAANAGRFGGTGLAITNASNVVQTEATVNNSLYLDNTGTTRASANLSSRSLFTITTAGWKLRERGITGGNYQVDFDNRRVYVKPIRVA